MGQSLSARVDLTRLEAEQAIQIFDVTSQFIHAYGMGFELAWSLPPKQGMQLTSIYFPEYVQLMKLRRRIAKRLALVKASCEQEQREINRVIATQLCDGETA